ncbi:MAG: ChbG/HpnK family deacetylase [Planctomycetota bacterium]|nr:ChbG/HpnK family deacetylase [Planctomycetota bacterium]
MFQIIFNADDAGIDEQRNEGIIRAFQAGCVRSTTAIVNGRAFKQIVSIARAEPGLGLGLHLNLTDGRPLSQAKSLAPSGIFKPKRELWSQAWHGRIVQEEVAAEFRAQIEAFLETGLVPTHLDGHNHIHVFPGVWEVLMRVMNEFPVIRGVRLPRESGAVIHNETGSDGVPEIRPAELSEGGIELERAGHRKAAFFRTLADCAMRSRP